MQEQTRWGGDTLGAGHPVTGNATHQLEGLGAGRDSKSNTWDDKLRHLVLSDIF